MSPCNTACVPWYRPQSKAPKVALMMKATSAERTTVRRRAVSKACSVETAKRSDAVVYGVSLGGRVRFLRDIAAFTGGSVFDVDSTKNLSAVFLKILDEFRHRYLVSFSPEGVSGSGWHRLEVKIKGRGATIKARPGYLRGEDAR